MSIPPKATASRPRAAAQLTLETLEDRAVPAVFTVDTFVDIVDPDDGVTSLREAVAYAQSNAEDDVVDLFSGTHVLSAGTLVIDDPAGAVTVRAASGSVIDSTGDRIFDVQPGGQLRLEGLTLTGADTTVDGGGVHNRGTLNVADTTFRGNTAARGGALANFGTATVTSSTFEANNGKSGGGAVFNSGSLTVSLSTFSGNTTNGSGGAISNSQPFFGGQPLQVTSSTFTLNNAGTVGGAVNTSPGATVTFGNSIVAGNTAGGPGDDLMGSYASQGFNLIGNADDASGFAQPGDLAGNSGTPIDPQLTPLANNGGRTATHGLSANSPAANVGDPALTGTADQRGVARPQGAGVDIGSFERTESRSLTIDVLPRSSRNRINLLSFQPVPVAVLSTDDFDATSLDTSDLSRFQLGDAEGDVTQSPFEAKFKDVNKDGKKDLVLYYSPWKLFFSGAMDFDTKQLKLSVTDDSGQVIEGTDEVKVVAKPKWHHWHWAWHFWSKRRGCGW